MDLEIAQTIIPLLSRENILRIHDLVGSEPVSFAALRQAVIQETIEEYLRMEMKDEEIAKRTGVCKRTVERHKRKKLLRFRNKSVTKF